jgi:hypothetical protein
MQRRAKLEDGDEESESQFKRSKGKTNPSTNQTTVLY